MYIFANGERFEGSLKQGMKHGNGVYFYENGNNYSGEWKKDLKENYGVYKYACNSLIFLIK